MSWRSPSRGGLSSHERSSGFVCRSWVSLISPKYWPKSKAAMACSLSPRSAGAAHRTRGVDLGIHDVEGALAAQDAGDLLQRDPLDAEGDEVGRAHVGIAGDDLRLERGHATREGAADVAEADDPDRLAVERARAARHAGAPRSRVHLAIQRDDLAVPRQ